MSSDKRRSSPQVRRSRRSIASHTSLVFNNAPLHTRVRRLLAAPLRRAR